MTRTFVLGIDGCSWRLLDSLDLPGFDRLLDGAATGTLRSTYPPITFPAWKCFSTGKNPGKLGVFGFANFDATSRTNRQNDATRFDGAELWDYVSEAGRGADVVNVPTTYPPHDVDGAMVAGPNATADDLVAPDDRSEEIADTGYVVLDSGHRLAFKSGGDTAVDAAEEVIASRFRTTRHLLDADDADLVVQALYCTDTIQHYYWDGDEVARTYRRIDEELRGLLDQLASDDDDWNVVLVSDHGFQPIEGALYLDTWLEDSGFLARRSDADDEASGRRIGPTTDGVTRLVNALGLERVVARLPDRLVSAVASRLADADAVPVVDAVDWDRSRAVFINGGIYVLDDEDGTSDELADALERATDPAGEPIVDTVVRGAEVYSGSHADAAPDLVPISRRYKLLGFSRDGTVYDPDDDWVAGHEMDGVFAATGPDFTREDDLALDIYDVAPTLLHAMGLAVPEDIDGEVRTDLLTTDEPVECREPLPSRHGTAISDSDAERMQERLEELGYVG